MTRRLLVSGAVSFLLSASAVFAQSSAEVNAGIQLNFSNPGGRSLGLGGAFIGLADDATAAYTNPAGLTILNKKEFSLEARQNRFTHQFTDAGHVALGSAPLRVTNRGVDTVTGLVTGHDENTVTDVSFISFVFPRERWAFAVYGHRLANFEADFRTNGIFTDEPRPNQDPANPDDDFSRFRYFPTTNALDLEVNNLAASFAFRLGGGVSLGVGVNYLDFQMNSQTIRSAFLVNEDGFAIDTPEPGGFIGPPNYSLENAANTQEQHGDETNITYSAGFIWRPSQRFGAGVVYRKGADFNVDVVSFGGAPPPTGELFAGVGRFTIPDVIGVGISVRPAEGLMLAADVNRVEYSATAEGFFAVFEEEPAFYKADDAYEYRIGFEYGFVGARNPIFVRLGSWFEPEHRIRYADDTVGQSVLFRKGNDEIHYSAGLGMVFGQRFELNAAIDLSDIVDTTSLSFITRF